MPRQAEWFQRLPEILEHLRRQPPGLLDRSAIAFLFQTSARQATRILHRLGASQIGGAFVIRQEDLISRLEMLQQDKRVVFELGRRERLEASLASVRRELRGRRIRILPPGPAQLLQIHQLPDDIKLTSGLLEIRFLSSVDLLEKLLLLAQTISEDWTRFEARVSENAAEAKNVAARRAAEQVL
jgi:hypothetical protein